MSRLGVASWVVGLCLPASGVAAEVQHVERELLTPPAVAANGQVVLRNIPLGEGPARTLVLEPFDVLAPNAVIRAQQPDGRMVEVAPRPMHQYRGRIEGDPFSLVYLASWDGAVSGLITTGERKWSIGSAGKRVRIEELRPDSAAARGFFCEVEGRQVRPVREMVPQSLAFDVRAESYSWPTATMTTMLNLVVDTDTSMFANFPGATAETIEIFTRDLIGATSTVFHRDLRTDLRITQLNIFTTSDPFLVNATTAGADAALVEYGDYWHANRAGTSRSVSVLLSGANTGGIAWLGALCQPELLLPPDYPPPYANHWWGPYAFCGSLGETAADRVIPDPEANPNNAAPAAGFWAIGVLGHELGHVVGANHTHCTALSAEDATTYGRAWVDLCYIDELSTCYHDGNPDNPRPSGIVPPELGTLMSYCDLNGSGTYFRYAFGKSGEASNVMLTNMRGWIDTQTPTGLTAITAPSSLAAGASGTASVTSSPGLTYDWTIVNGTINSGQGTAAINFTANAHPVTLRVTATAASGCAVSDTKEVAVIVPVNPPANVVATATAATVVGVSWSAAAGAASYRVYRSGNNSTYSLVGTTASTSFNDTAAVANTAYFYKVRTLDGSSNESADSNKDLATTTIFTDAVLNGTVSAKTVHVSQLRTAVNAVRTLAGLSAAAFTDPAMTTTTQVKRLHLTELRAALDGARTTLGLTALTYTDASITALVTKVKAAHLTELRNGVK